MVLDGTLRLLAESLLDVLARSLDFSCGGAGCASSTPKELTAD